MSLPWQQIIKMGIKLMRSGAVNPAAVIATATSAFGGAAALGSIALRTAGGAWRVVTLPLAVVVGAVGLTVEKRLRADEPPAAPSEPTWKQREARLRREEMLPKDTPR